MQKLRFLVCEDNKTIIEVISEHQETISCNGKPMHELVPNSTNAAQEKHVPVVTVNGNTVKVDVGSVRHPMEEGHSIKWVCIHTNQGVQRKCLKENTEPVVEFALCPNEKLLETYAFCDLHGLWMMKSE